MRARILSQGAFDGFCLLYAIMNAEKALTAPEKSALSYLGDPAVIRRWGKLVGLTPSLENFANGSGIVFPAYTKDGEARVTHGLMKSYCFALSEKRKKTIEVDVVSFADAVKTDFLSSVLVFCIKSSADTGVYKGLDHWVCCAGIDDVEGCRLVCSYALHYMVNLADSIEKSDVRGRAYNNVLPHRFFSEKHVYPDMIYRLTLN